MWKRNIELTKPSSPKVLPSKTGVDCKCPPDWSNSNKNKCQESWHRTNLQILTKFQSQRMKHPAHTDSKIERTGF